MSCAGRTPASSPATDSAAASDTRTSSAEHVLLSQLEHVVLSQLARQGIGYFTRHGGGGVAVEYVLVVCNMCKCHGRTTTKLLKMVETR